LPIPPCPYNPSPPPPGSRPRSHHPQASAERSSQVRLARRIPAAHPGHRPAPRHATRRATPTRSQSLADRRSPGPRVHRAISRASYGAVPSRSPPPSSPSPQRSRRCLPALAYAASRP
jgi:hypothetical protein